MPFSGLRHFEIEISGDSATGRVFDPYVSEIGNNGRKELTFSLKAVENEHSR